MSDDQIRDLIDSAEEWSPDVDENQDDDEGGGGAAGPNLPLPPLQLGSDVEIATCVAQMLCHERGKVIFSEGHFWYYLGSHWRTINDKALRRAVHRYDGTLVPGARSLASVKLNKARVDSVLYEMSAILDRPDFFGEAPVGINSASGFIAFASDGTVSVQPHRPEHRCRHVLSAFLKRDYWPRRG